MQKSIGAYFTQHFKMPHLYREDLEALDKVVRDELKPQMYRLACEGLEFDGLADVPQDIARTGVLVLYTHHPWLRLKLARSWAELYAGDDGSDVDEAVRRIARIIARCERPWLWMFCKYSAWLAPLLGFGSVAIAIGLIALGAIPLQSLYVVLWLLLMISIWWGVGHRYSLVAYSCIDFREPRPAVLLAGSGRDRLVFFLAGLLLGAATLGLFAKFFGWL